MKYIDEVCSVLSDEAERRYLRTRDAWQLLTDEMAAVDEATPELTSKLRKPIRITSEPQRNTWLSHLRGSS